MIGWLGDWYLWVKAAHVVFVIFWMAGLFMLPRFLVYHQEAAVGSPEAAIWTVREGRLIRIILNPAIVVVWAAGLALILHIGEARSAWFHGKFAVVVGLSLYHWWAVRYADRLAEGRAGFSGRTLRLLNEVPSLATIAIVILVIVRPWS